MRSTYFFTLFLISFYLLLISCGGNQFTSPELGELRGNEIGIVKMRVDHYKQAAYGPHLSIFNRTQEGPKIGNEYWSPQYAPLENFDYEWGYKYEILVKKSEVENPPIDGSSIRYNVLKIVSKRKVENNEQFRITLKTTGCSGCDLVLSGDKKSGFSLAYSKPFDCGKFCDELSEIRKINRSVIGIFEHELRGKIRLVGLESQ